MSLRDAALATLRGQSWRWGTVTGEQIIAVYRAIEAADSTRWPDPEPGIKAVFWPSNPEQGEMQDRRIDRSLQKLKTMKLIRFDKTKRRWTTRGLE